MNLLHHDVLLKIVPFSLFEILPLNTEAFVVTNLGIYEQQLNTDLLFQFSVLF